MGRRIVSRSLFSSGRDRLMLFLALIFLQIEGIVAPTPTPDPLAVTPEQLRRRVGPHEPDWYSRWTYDEDPVAKQGSLANGRVRCIGIKPTDLPEVSYGTTYKSLLEICAEPQYGGKVKDMVGLPSNNGGFCATYFAGTERFVMNRPIPDYKTPFDPAWHRWLLCHTKCACAETRYRSWRTEANAGKSNINLPPVEREDAFVWLRVGDYAGRTVTKKMEESAPNAYEVPIPVLPLPEEYQSRQLEPRRLIEWTRKTTVVGKIANQIGCDGPLPAWTFPNERVHKHLLDACAASIIGGNLIANMGMLCENPHHNKVVIVDSLAHPDYSASVCQFYPDSEECNIRTLLKLYCHSRCYCSLKNREGSKNVPPVKVKDYGSVTLKDDWYLEIKRKDKTLKGRLTGAYITRSIGPGKPKPINGGGDDSGGEGGSGGSGAAVTLESAKCFSADEVYMPDCPDVEYKPVADGRQPQLSKYIDYTATAAANADEENSALDLDAGTTQTCGATCQGVADCGGGGAGCTCRVDRRGSLRSETVDPVQGRITTYVFTAACYIIGTTRAASGVKPISGGGRKRGLEEMDACACNATYVSEGCCGSSDGIIWEDSTFKLGVLT